MVSEQDVMLNWENNFSIKVLGGDEIIIKANSAGLTSLARHLLTLAQEDVPKCKMIQTGDSDWNCFYAINQNELDELE